MFQKFIHEWFCVFPEYIPFLLSVLFCCFNFHLLRMFLWWGFGFFFFFVSTLFCFFIFIYCACFYNVVSAICRDLRLIDKTRINTRINCWSIVFSEFCNCLVIYVAEAKYEFSQEFWINSVPGDGIMFSSKFSFSSGWCLLLIVSVAAALLLILRQMHPVMHILLLHLRWELRKRRLWCLALAGPEQVSWRISTIPRMMFKWYHLVITLHLPLCFPVLLVALWKLAVLLNQFVTLLGR